MSHFNPETLQRPASPGDEPMLAFKNSTHACQHPLQPPEHELLTADSHQPLSFPEALPPYAAAHSVAQDAKPDFPLPLVSGATIESEDSLPFPDPIDQAPPHLLPPASPPHRPNQVPATSASTTAAAIPKLPLAAAHSNLAATGNGVALNGAAGSGPRGSTQLK